MTPLDLTDTKYTTTASIKDLTANLYYATQFIDGIKYEKYNTLLTDDLTKISSNINSNISIDNINNNFIQNYIINNKNINSDNLSETVNIYNKLNFYNSNIKKVALGTFDINSYITRPTNIIGKMPNQTSANVISNGVNKIVYEMLENYSKPDIKPNLFRGGMDELNSTSGLEHNYKSMNGGKKKSKKGGMAQINEAASPITQFDLANGYSTLMNGGKKRKSKKGGMMELNPSADPTVQSDLLNGLSTLTGGKKSKKEKKSKKGGMMELNPSDDPAVQSDLLNGLSTLTGGKKSKKEKKSKKGGADPPANTSAILNMSNMVSMSDPYTMAQTRVAGEDAPSPFSSGMPNYASVEYGLPANMTNSLSGGLDQRVTTGGAKKSRGKGKKGGNILEGVQTILRRLSSPKTAEVEVVKTEEKLEPNVGELVGGKKKAKKSKKSGGNIGEFTGAYDWQTQLSLDAKSNMAGGKKNLKK